MNKNEIELQKLDMEPLISKQGKTYAYVTSFDPINEDVYVYDLNLSKLGTVRAAAYRWKHRVEARDPNGTVVYAITYASANHPGQVASAALWLLRAAAQKPKSDESEAIPF